MAWFLTLSHLQIYVESYYLLKMYYQQRQRGLWMKDMNLKEEIQSISSKNYELTIDLASSSIFLFFFHLAVSYVNPSPALEFLNLFGV